MPYIYLTYNFEDGVPSSLPELIDMCMYIGPPGSGVDLARYIVHMCCIEVWGSGACWVGVLRFLSCREI